MIRRPGLFSSLTILLLLSILLGGSVPAFAILSITTLEVDKLFSGQPLLFIMIIVFFVFWAILFSWIYKNSIGKSLSQVRRSLRQLGQGGLDSSLPSTAGPRELNELARDVHQQAIDIQHQHSRSEQMLGRRADDLSAELEEQGQLLFLLTSFLRAHPDYLASGRESAGLQNIDSYIFLIEEVGASSRRSYQAEHEVYSLRTVLEESLIQLRSTETDSKRNTAPGGTIVLQTADSVKDVRKSDLRILRGILCLIRFLAHNLNTQLVLSVTNADESTTAQLRFSASFQAGSAFGGAGEFPADSKVILAVLRRALSLIGSSLNVRSTAQLVVSFTIEAPHTPEKIKGRTGQDGNLATVRTSATSGSSVKTTALEAGEKHDTQTTIPEKELNLEQLKEQSTYMFSLLEQFLEESESSLAELENMLAQEKWQESYQLVDDLKTGAETLFAGPLSERSEEIGKIIRKHSEKPDEDDRVLVWELLTSLRNSFDEVQTFCEQNMLSSQLM